MKNPVTAIRLPLRPGREYESRFDREPSLLKMLAIPIASVVLASMVTTLPISDHAADIAALRLPDVPELAADAARDCCPSGRVCRSG